MAGFGGDLGRFRAILGINAPICGEMLWIAVESRHFLRQCGCNPPGSSFLYLVASVASCGI